MPPAMAVMDAPGQEHQLLQWFSIVPALVGVKCLLFLSFKEVLPWGLQVMSVRLIAKRAKRRRLFVLKGWGNPMLLFYQDDEALRRPLA